MPSWKKVVLHGSSGSLAHLTLENLTSQSVLATDASGNVIAGSISGYTLPTASTSTLGGIKVGNTLNISSGVLDAKTYQGAVATVLGEVPGSAGTAGIVPAASPAQASYFLKGDGTWAAPTNTVTRLRADNASSLLAGDFTITGSGATTVGYNNGVFTISSTDHDTTYSLFSGASASVNGAAGLVPGPRTGDQIKFLKGDGTWAVTPDTTYSTATSAALGLVKIGFTESGKDYPIELNASGQMFVNVPWSDTNTDTNTTYSIEGNQGDAGTTIVLTGSDNSKSSLIVAGSGATNVSYDTLLNTLTISSTDTNTDTTYSTATSTTLGLVKIGYTENGKNYPVELSSGQMFVNVPWTDTDTNTNTTYDLSAASITNGAAINLAGSDSTTDAVNIKGSGATTVSYDSTNRVLVISSTDTNTDTDTTYTAGTGLTLSGTTFSVTANTYAPASHTHSYLPLAGGTLTGALNINNSTQGSDAFYVDGVNGRLFTITDDLSDSLFSVNTIAGLPVIEAFADNTVKIGPFTSPVTIDTSGLLYVEGNQVATQTYVNTAISNLIDGAPAALDTLNELAAAINDNDSYASTITTALADKAPLASPALTGTPTAPTADTATNTTQIATTAFVKAQGYLKSYTDTVTRLGTGTGDLRSGDILLKGGGATSIAFASGTFTISSTDTNTWRDIHDTPVDGATTTSISSNWAFDNVKTAVPAGAVFTDTVYTHPTTAGNKHIPSGGSSGQILRWSADGTATWGADNDTTYSDATASRAGLMSTTDKSKLDGIAASANNYSLPIATASVLGGVKIGYTASGKNYPVQLSNEQMYVNVPWTDTDTNTTYSAGTGLSLSGTTFNVGYAPYAYKVAAPPRNAFTVGGSADTFYPVVFNMAGGATANQLGTIQIERGGYDDPGYTGIGFSTMHIRLTMKPSGWGYGADFYRVDSYRATANLVAKLDRISQSSKLVIWLRGATRYWWFDVENGASLHFDNSAGETYRETNGVHYDYSFDPVTTIADNLQYTRYEPGSQYYGGALKVVGNIYTDGTVDGRDIAADGTKLDGIASGANNYSLPVASASTLGGIKVGTNLSISDGVLSSTDTNTWRPLGTGATDAAAGNHTHDDRYYTETEVDTLLAGKQAAGTYLTSLPSHNHDDRYFTETESDSRFLKLAGGTMTGTLTAPTIVPTLFHYAYGWRKYFKTRSVGVAGGSINGKWVHLFSVEIAGSYDKALIKAKLNGYDDVSIGTEVIHALYENGGSTQENHDLYWYSIDNTASLFKAVKSIRTSASGLRNTYEVWAQMAGDWRDTFTMEVEFWEEENRALTFGTANGQDAEPTGDSNDIVKTSRQWAVNSNLYIGGNITLAGTVDGRDIATDGTKLDGIAANANNYSLPAASASTLGGIKVGTNLSIDTNGVVSSTDTNTWRPLGTGATDAAAGNHTHDDRYYTETEVDTLLAGKLGSTAKAADSNLLDGLDLHTGRNNEANKVVRTDDSGYIQAGWINTTSGGRSPATRIDRVYASDDSYLRYYSLEDFKVAIGLPKNSFNRQADYSATAGYHTGIMGYSNTYDVFNGLPHLGSGFIEFWNSPANAPDDSHWVGLQSFHAVNWGGVAGRNYGWQMVHRGGTTGDIRFNAQWGDSDYGWITIWNSANLTAVSQLTNDSGYITSYTDTNTVTSVGISGDLSTGNITLAGSGATSITKSGGTITITSTDTDTTYSNATTERAGLMSTTDKTKLDGIAASANNYSLPAASATVLGGIKIGTNLSIDTNGVVSSTDTNTWRPLGTGATDAAAGNHTHDDRYYTETESDGRYILNDFALITGATSEDVKSGTWSEVANNSSWGSYKPGNDSAAGYAYNDAPGYMEYNIPSGYSTAYIGQLRWDTGGYFDVHAVRSDGALVLRGRYLSKGAIENSSHSGDHDNQQIIKISGLDGMRSIRITNVTGRLHFQGIGWSKEADTDGTQVSETHWDLIYNKPSTFTPSSHTHDDRYYTESEVDTLLADKQASGTYLTALPAHTHTLSELSDRPGWFSPDTNMTANLANFNNSVPSGFYQYSNATNAPGSGWYNLINVRHSNRANDHGFQIAASYYDENIWTRTYQNGTGNNDGTFTTWRSLVHSGNIGSQSVNYAASAGSATTAGTVTGKSSIGKTAHTAGADDYHLELYSSDTGDSSKEVSIRFHQGSRYYAQLRYRSGGFRFTGGADDNLTPVYASTFYGDLSGNATTATTAGTANAVSWTNVSDKPTIPTNNNQLTNGAGYITSYVDTVTRVGITDDVSSGDIVIRGAGATTVSKSGGTITITSTDTDTNTWRPLGTGATDAAAGNHLHDDRYYTESEVDTLLGTKAASSHTHNIILTQGNYVWDASTRAGDYTTGIQTSFVNSATGWPDYGAVLHVGARGGGDAGGDFQLYMGHGSNYGGTSLRVRSADNDAEVSDSWTEWKTILDSSNVGNYALTALPSHTHDDRYYTESEVDTLLAGKAASSHTHDDRYYTETEVDTLLGGKLGSTAKAADSELIDGIDSTAIIYGGAGRASSRVSSMNDTNQKSGFYYEYSPTGNPFGEWWNWMTVAGNSWQSSNNYSFQLAHNFHGDDFYVRRMTNGTAYDWRKILDSSNIGSYAAAVSHTHDDRYYTESEVDTLLGTKAASSHTHGIGSITDASRWWNNFGDNHSTRTSFDAAGGTLSTGFGWRFVQGSGNSPGWGSVGNGQYYALTVGLGNDYDSNLYGMQLAIPRNSTNPYLSVRFEENRVLGAWQKISAAYADSAGSVAWSNVSGKPSTFDPSAHTHDDRYYTESEVDSLLNAKGAAIPVDQGGEALGNLASIEIVQEEQRVEFTTTSGNKFSVMLVA